jgi:hypothetical protein
MADEDPSNPNGVPYWGNDPYSPRRPAGGVLDSEQHSTAPLTAHREPLYAPKQHQGVLASDTITEVREDDGADRTDQEPDTEGAEGE